MQEMNLGSPSELHQGSGVPSILMLKWSVSERGEWGDAVNCTYYSVVRSVDCLGGAGCLRAWLLERKELFSSLVLLAGQIFLHLLPLGTVDGLKVSEQSGWSLWWWRRLGSSSHLCKTHMMMPSLHTALKWKLALSIVYTTFLNEENISWYQT